MIVEALDKLYPKNSKEKHRLTLTAFCSENLLVDTMKLIPSYIDMSSLPQIQGEKRITVISIASYDKNNIKKYFNLFIEYLIKNDVEYVIN
jgi:hypothetical protein